ncbi:siderophore-interacting protein [Agreia pratensis]|uniref:siderophore-interacting protein n=1 Tax=Agreia pratensis TaxID=150121 RepID=UPI001E3C985E|nr:siderophore-interacting protein [Agreia pratensis]
MSELHAETASSRKRKSPSRLVPTSRRMLTAEVHRVQRLSESMVGITIGGPELEHFEYQGADQFFRFFFRRPGQDVLRMPTWGNDGWLAQYLLMAAPTRPHCRIYTARSFRPESNELDIEFVAHGDSSPASGWAVRAQPGDPVGIFDEGTTYNPPAVDGWQLLVGDESAMPAILSILEGSPADLRAQVFLEVPHAADIREITVPDGVDMHWLPRENDHAIPGRLALEALVEAQLPAENPSYAYLAGESGLATGARRFLVNERGMPKSDVKFQGYWKHGKASPG